VDETGSLILVLQPGCQQLVEIDISTMPTKRKTGQLFQFTAPEGFSTCRSAPASTKPEVAVSLAMIDKSPQAYSFPSLPFVFNCAKN
jgi:hypothetical protein